MLMLLKKNAKENAKTQVKIGEEEHVKSLLVQQVVELRILVVHTFQNASMPHKKRRRKTIRRYYSIIDSVSTTKI